MKLIPTAIHGMIDFSGALFLLALPRLFRWPARATRFISLTALAATGYSLMTRYELGLIKLIPFRFHLLLDSVKGLAYLVAAVMMPGARGDVRAWLAGIGLTEFLIMRTSETAPRAEIIGTGRKQVSRETAETVDAVTVQTPEMIEGFS